MGFFDFLKKKTTQSQDSRNTQIGKKLPTISVTISEPATPEEMDANVIPAEVRATTAVVSKHGLYPHEILVLGYAHTYYTSDNSFQRFWWWRYGVRDVQSILNSLVKRGFLSVGDLKAVLSRQTVVNIKEVLKNYNIKTTGRKAELVQRMLDEMPKTELNRLFQKRIYHLTELGETVLNEEEYIMYIHRRMIEGMDIWSLNILVHTKPYMPYRDKIWRYLNQRILEHISVGQFGNYRNCRLAMSKFLQEEKRYKNSLAMLAEVVLYDLNGASNNYNHAHLNIYAKSFFPYENSQITIPPGIIAEIVVHQEKLGLSDDELKVVLKEQMDKLGVPLQLFSADECIQIVFLERDKDIEGLRKIYTKAENNFKQKYPHIEIYDTRESVKI